METKKINSKLERNKINKNAARSLWRRLQIQNTDYSRCKINHYTNSGINRDNIAVIDAWCFVGSTLFKNPNVPNHA